MRNIIKGLGLILMLAFSTKAAHCYSSNIKVAVIDNGFDLDHECFRNRTAPTIIHGENTPDGHGTPVTALIGGNMPVLGMCPEAELHLFDVGNAFWLDQSAIAASIRKSIDLGVHVINLSFGGPPNSKINILIQEADAKGIIVVAAAGNILQLGLQWPANLPTVIAAGTKGYFVSDENTILTDSYQITSANNTGITAKWWEGTSFSAPIVSGYCARLLSMGLPAKYIKANLSKEVPVDPLFYRDSLSASGVSIKFNRKGFIAKGMAAENIHYPSIVNVDNFYFTVDSEKYKHNHEDGYKIQFRIRNGKLKIKIRYHKSLYFYALSRGDARIRFFQYFD